MRIGVIGPLGQDRFARNLIDALSDTGHVAIPLGPARARYRSRLATRVADLSLQAITRLDQLAQRRIVRAAEEGRCEIIISVDARLMPETVAALRRNGRRIALWFPDPVSSLGRALMLLAPYDAVFFKDHHMVNRLRAMLDLPIYYLPQACNPRHHRPLVPAGTRPYLVIAGGVYPSRARLLERLTAAGIPVRVYGGKIPRWLDENLVRTIHAGRPVFAEEKARVFRSAAGVLNTLQLGEIEGVNSRLFEAAGSGAAVLSEFRPVIPEMFRPDEEVLLFRDFDELVRQARRLLDEPGLTSRLGDAAARRAHRDHTIAQRLPVIIDRLS